MQPPVEIAHAPTAVPPELLWIPVVLIVARLAGAVERWGQPPVLGELLAGVVLGNLGLLGIDILAPMARDPILAFLAQLGAVILLFHIGLQTSLVQMRRVGPRALLVAVVGVAAPFAGGMVAAPWLLPGSTVATHLFLGAALTATSVGITARVFLDLQMLQSPEAQIVLGAAVIDDVLGLVILATVAALITSGTITLGTILAVLGKAIAFLVVAIVAGVLLAPVLARLLSTVHPGRGMKLTLALSVALLTAYAAGLAGLAPIVGAFAAGLVLTPLHFRRFAESDLARDVRLVLPEAAPALRRRLARLVDRHAERHLEELIEPLAHLLVPVFFVMTGMLVDLSVFTDVRLLGVAGAFTVIAVAGKVISGAVAGPVRRLVVGWGMVPRGEVGLIFAAMGQSLGAVDAWVFSTIVVVVIATTFITPPILAGMLRRGGGHASA